MELLSCALCKMLECASCRRLEYGGNAIDYLRRRLEFILFFQAGVPVYNANVFKHLQKAGVPR